MIPRLTSATTPIVDWASRQPSLQRQSFTIARNVKTPVTTAQRISGLARFLFSSPIVLSAATLAITFSATYYVAEKSGFYNWAGDKLLEVFG